METSAIHELRPSFKERNHVLVLLLGVRSFSSRWQQLVDSQVRAVHSDDRSQDIAVRLQPDEGLLYCLLGMVSFSRRLEAAIESASQIPAEDASGEVSSPAWDNLHDLLR